MASHGTPYGQTLTLAEFCALPEAEERQELVRGRLVREPLPGARHGLLASRLHVPLGAHVARAGLGAAFAAETGFLLSEDPPTVRGPDISFVAAARIPPDGLPTGFFPGAPDLAVEVASPANRWSELHDKALDYLDAGARLVWIIDPAARRVTQFRSQSEIRILAGNDALEGGEVVPGFAMRLEELFGG
jgi:Uma2 family endonuclease